MTLFQRFMRVLTHPQHAGEPLPARKPKKAKPPAASQSLKVASKHVPSAAAGSKSADSTTNGSEDEGAVAVAERPRASIPTAPSSPVEVFASDRESSLDENSEPLGGSLLDGLEDSSMGLAGDAASADSRSGSSGSSEASSTALDKPDEPTGSEIGEVFELIEKLRDHVDAQNGRFEHAMGVLDQIKTSAAALPEIRERIDSMLASIDELKANQFKGHEKVERALAAQSARLDTIAQAIERATQREERLATSLVEINQTILAVSTTNDRLASAIDAMRRHEAERDARIGRALTGAQRWLVVLTLVMAVGMVATILTAVLAVG